MSELTTWFDPNQITYGYSEFSQIFLDKPAPTQVNIVLRSDDPGLVTVPPFVTVPPGSTSAAITFTAVPIGGPFSTRSTNVHATYGGKTLTVTCEVVPPKLASLTVSPDTIKSGETATGTVTLNLPSVLGSVVVDVRSEAIGYAIVDSPVTIPQNGLSLSFPITSPDMEIAHKTARAIISATYAGDTRQAPLKVKSKIVAGILDTLTIVPTLVTAGDSSRGTVTLVEGVPVKTIVGLAALEPGSGLFPRPGNESSIATVPGSITIPPGETSGGFTISTTDLLPPGTVRKATIVAGAISNAVASLTAEA